MKFARFVGTAYIKHRLVTPEKFSTSDQNREEISDGNFTAASSSWGPRVSKNTIGVFIRPLLPSKRGARRLWYARSIQPYKIVNFGSRVIKNCSTAERRTQPYLHICVFCFNATPASARGVRRTTSTRGNFLIIILRLPEVNEEAGDRD